MQTIESSKKTSPVQAKPEQPFFTPSPYTTQKNTGKAPSGEGNGAHASFFPARSQAIVQPKLTINEPGDRYEQEADAMADRVMRMSASTVGGDTSPGHFWGSERMIVQRKCAACEQEEKIQRQEKEEDEILQTKPLMRKSAEGGYTASPQLSSQLSSSKGGGSPLPGQTLASMSQAFGADFSSVRIHTGSQAAEMSEGIQAKAFTHGSDIYFNRGQYNPESSEGRRLLGHELTHVVQQKKDIVQRFTGCNSTQDSTILTDRVMALLMLSVAIRKLGSYNGTVPVEVQTALNTHFHGATSAGFASWIKINLQFLRSLAPLAGYQCETTGGSFWACTQPSTFATTFWCIPGVDIRICPLYFSQSSIERATTLIHEWVHKYGCNFDLGYEHDSGYSGNSTLTQLLNADSFANFVRDVQ